MVDRYKTITEIPGWFNRLTDDGVPDNIATLYASVPILYRAVKLRCDLLSAVPIKLVQGEDKEVQWPYPTRLPELIWKWEASMLLAGAAYGEIVKNRSGYQRDIVYRNPFDMTVKYQGSGVLEFTQQSTGMKWQNDMKSGTYEMLYFAEYDPSQDLLPGVGAGKVAQVNAKLLHALSKFPEMYFEGGAMPVTMLGIETTDKGEIERVATWFRKSATMIKNAFRVLGVRAKAIDVKTLTPPMKEMAFEELTQIAKDNIALSFGIRKTMLDSEAANYATAQEDRLSTYEDTIKPRSIIFKNGLEQQLFNKDRIEVEFGFDEMDIFQEGEKDRASVAQLYYSVIGDKLLALELAGKYLTDEQKLMVAKQQGQKDEPETTDKQDDNDPLDEELKRWQRMAEKRVKEGKAIREFETSIIPASLHGAISGALESVKSVDDVKRIFTGVIEWQGYP